MRTAYADVSTFVHVPLSIQGPWNTSSQQKNALYE